jgi:hypothetical protein
VTCDRFSQISYNNKTDRHDIAEILLKVVGSPGTVVVPDTVVDPWVDLLISETVVVITGKVVVLGTVVVSGFQGSAVTSSYIYLPLGVYLVYITIIKVWEYDSAHCAVFDTTLG